ncbi:TetR/AcrR family transcriptional regulator [Mycolicibacterium parafortuitum]|uniref:Putative transcriptional regulatory protein (Possibly TetR-family) [Mycobacterium tuberculosis H37Rv] n=1 Tax=Mycolicibacterium parafortuitum TaxID=39692 RepID=A0A375YFH1_MYCPF|nr:TetR/AcrR family transcriptional regulator [Mycolicibacterium parafortuitum]ORB31386.1 TetR family transcriptional regulator [Mycolicibacterium parafortuitum]SRX79866.1 putative transcriptional regulatory protein (possibly TetR-family) [Mycobacterium tuberculosis H37Rv] [Mycolicibacterium parafortuitum]
MTRPLRADAARNRARVLEVAYDTFAAEGLGVPIDEIARRAGVGAGTVYRHFPTKEALVVAVAEDRVRRIVEHAQALLAGEEPGAALFVFLQDMVRSAAADHGLVDALVGYGLDLEVAAPGAEAAFLAAIGELLDAAQRAGTVRADVDVAVIKALLVVCKVPQVYGGEISERVVQVIEDGLRAR